MEHTLSKNKHDTDICIDSNLLHTTPQAAPHPSPGKMTSLTRLLLRDPLLRQVIVQDGVSGVQQAVGHDAAYYYGLLLHGRRLHRPEGTHGTARWDLQRVMVDYSYMYSSIYMV